MLLLLCLIILLFPSISSVRDELMEAVHVADVQQVDYLLSLDPEILSARPPVLVNRKENEHDRTSIMVCGLDPQTPDRTLLDMNCAHIARALHQRGAILHHVDRHGWDALAMASSQGLKYYAQYLLEHGVAVENVDYDGKTAAMKAAAHGFASVFELLLGYGASISRQDANGRTALHYATIHSLNSSYDAVRFIQRIRGSVLKHIDQQSNTSSVLNETNTLQFPLDLAVDHDNRTCLMYAAISNNQDVVMTLLRDEKGHFLSDPRRTDSYGVSAISMSSDAEIRELLSDAAADLSQQEHQQWLRSTHHMMRRKSKPRPKSKSSSRQRDELR